MALNARCVACTGRAVQRHHVIYRQELKWRGGSMKDKRNLVPVCKRCHEKHHQAVERLPMRRLPDEFFEFARDLMGAGPAYEWVRRFYAGSDPRHDALLEAA